MSEVWSQTHKSPLKTHTEALKIQNFHRGDPLTPLTRGRVTLSCSPPLVPSALDDFLRRTTFKYAATALLRAVLENVDELIRLTSHAELTNWSGYFYAPYIFYAVLSAANFCKQFGPRSGKKMPDLILIQTVNTQMVFLKEFSEKVCIDKKSSTRQESMQNYPVGRVIENTR